MQGDLAREGLLGCGTDRIRQSTEAIGWDTSLSFADGTRGELFAATMFLQHAGVEARLGFDCDLIRKGMVRGRQWCVASSRPYADLWRSFWAHHERVGAGYHDGPIQLRKVKAHTTKTMVEQGAVHGADKQGNDAADKAAKAALKMHAQPAKRQVEEADALAD